MLHPQLWQVGQWCPPQSQTMCKHRAHMAELQSSLSQYYKQYLLLLISLNRKNELRNSLSFSAIFCHYAERDLVKPVTSSLTRSFFCSNSKLITGLKRYLSGHIFLRKMWPSTEKSYSLSCLSLAYFRL